MIQWSKEILNPKGIFTVLLLCCITFSTFAQQLSIKFNWSNAENTLEILQSEEVSDQTYDELIALESTQGLIKKLYSSDSLLISALKQADTGKDPEDHLSSFQYDLIKENTDSITPFISYLKNNEQLIAQRLDRTLSKYVAKGSTMEVEVIGILGGNATGYTFNNPDKFYISLHHMKSDPDFFFGFCQHELFHNIQAALFDSNQVLEDLKSENPENKDYIIYYLLNALFMEGTATYLDDWENKPFTKANKEIKIRSNLNKNRLNFINYMFDRLMVDIAAEPRLKGLNAIYNIFFTTNFEEAGYYLGKELTKYTVENGKNGLNYYLSKPPTYLLLDYFEYSKNDPDAPLNFSDPFIAIVTDLHNKVVN